MIDERALYQRYHMAKACFEQVCDERNVALAEVERLRRLADGRIRPSIGYLMASLFFVAGLVLGLIL